MYFCFEGVDGTGKSTIMKMLAKRFQNTGELKKYGIDEVIMTKEPEGIFRDIILDPDNKYKLNETARMFLYQADRAVHYENTLKEKINDDKVLVLSDRGPISTLVYQNYVLNGDFEGFDNPIFDVLKSNTDLAIDGNWPENVLTFYVDDINIILKRLEDLGEKDYFDLKSREFFANINHSYLELPLVKTNLGITSEFIFINASETLDIVEENTYNKIIKLIKERGSDD